MCTPSLVSVMIPTYNRKEMLKECLDSVLAQDYTHIEIIVSDNASVDGTHIMMDEYLKNYSNITYIRRPENIGGVNNARLAYERVHGDYFIIICDDDFMGDTHFFSEAVKAMDENKNIALVRGLTVTQFETEDGRICHKISLHHSYRLIPGLEFYRLYESGAGYEHIDGFFALCRKEFLDLSGAMVIPQPGLDRWLWSLLPLYGDVCFIPRIIGCYRQLSVGQDSQNIEYALSYSGIYQTVKDISDRALQKYPGQKDLILACRKPEVETATLILFNINILRKYKSDKEILKELQQSGLRKYPDIYRELLKISGLRLRDKCRSKLGKITNRVLRLMRLELRRI